MANLDQVFDEGAARRLDPIAVFADWYTAARESEPSDPETVCLATALPDGTPSARMVLLRGFGPDGFSFYTNTESQKGVELAKNPKAAMCFYWKTLRRQIRIQGPVVPVGAADADAYFTSRPRGSRLGAWASAQSRPLDSRAVLKTALEKEDARYADGEIPRPPHWSGYRVQPDTIEFWLSQISRCHDRMLFTRGAGGWLTQRLYP